MKAMVVFELQPNNTFKAVTVFQATPGKLFGKTLPGGRFREENVAAIIAAAKPPMIHGHTGQLGTMEDWIEWALGAMFNGYKTTARVVPEKTIQMLYEREVLNVEPQPMTRPDLRTNPWTSPLHGSMRAPRTPERLTLRVIASGSVDTRSLVGLGSRATEDARLHISTDQYVKRAARFRA